MLIVLPPSETKATGGEHPPLALDSLLFAAAPGMTDARTQITTDLVALCSGDDAAQDKAREQLGLSARLAPEVEANAALWDSPTLPALERYTGVLYEALDVATLPERARRVLAVGSALFGVVGGDDLIPHYRLSATSKLPDAQGQTPTMRKRWGKAITDALTTEVIDAGELLIDLRSGGYQNLGKVAQAVTVRVESEAADGSRKVISHFNKHYKGLLARDVAMTAEHPASLEELLELLRDEGWTIEHDEGLEITAVIRDDA